MAQQLSTTTENNFTKGLITEATGLNFPENAATDTDNCVYTLIGDVTRRLGINKEENGVLTSISRTGLAVSTYKWNNVGGDGETQAVVEQVGSILYFYVSSTATISSPISAQKLASTVDVSSFVTTGGTFDPTVECQFSDGNGYLFVYHPTCDPLYCTYSTGTLTANVITVQIRDFAGIAEPGVSVNYRPSASPSQLTGEHLYNLINQGWTQGNPWAAYSTSNTSSFVPVATGSYVFTGVAASLPATSGTPVNLFFTGTIFPTQYNGTVIASGIVTAYSGTTLTVSVNSVAAPNTIFAESPGTWTIVPTDQGYLNTWAAGLGNYPANADVWWYYKDNTDTFNPVSTIGNVTLASGNAPNGHFLLNAFKQQRTLVSGVVQTANVPLTDVTTTVRPRTGCWFQGRVWYAGVDAQQAPTGDEPYYTWTENIYFSQIVETTADFGSCYQLNDPTSENLFDLLPTDGGVIDIQGSGSIYRLFPIANGMLVFAANGVWFITGSQGIGFSANDYTITKISAVRSISPYSFVDVNGLPYFWNEEGIYTVEPQQGGSLSVNPITVGTILTFYNDIPLISKRYARAAYDPINYFIQWVYKSANETSVTDRYTFDKVLTFNTYNKAFYPYTVSTTNMSINSIVYVASPGGLNTGASVIKFLATDSTHSTFAEEYDDAYVDWGNANYISYFVTGYKLRGQGIKKSQPQYIQVFSRQNGAMTSYKIQGIWDYANDRSSGRWSSIQLVTNALTRFDTVFRRHKIRGSGYVLQFKIQSVDGLPFDIQGWATVDTTNTGT